MNPNSFETVHMDSQLGTQSSSKKNIVWTEKMDICLTETLKEQVHKGQKPDRSFSYHAYQATCAELYAKCGIKVEVDHIKNRLKTLKRDMGAFQDMQNSSSGFAFNRVTRMMDAEPKVWEDYIKAHPGAKQFRYKPVPCFEHLQIIYGKDRAVGLASETIKERRVRIENERDESSSINTNQDDREAVQENDIECIGPSKGKEQDPKTRSATGTSSKVIYKRKHSATSNLGEELDGLKSGMESIASAIWKTGPRFYTEGEIFEELSKVEGLNEDEQLVAYDYLTEDAARGRNFIGLPIHRRKRWLEIKLGWASHNLGIGTRRGRRMRD
ncbi:uncharacterized protein LOC109824646 isoform X2 [Asparagus officinalis]|uniref:uncharacterized protein LOC109824646 isoform X2 n=1 Tax=Asparagus officinalis TaxID=4686 RepID=UPI00098E667F|nr:uncharacterized protein LOC109824646 isoform X2 [Asparagus officinalis]